LNLQIFQQRNANGSMREYMLYEETKKTMDKVLFLLGHTKYEPGEVMKSLDFVVTSISELQGRKYVYFY
jgi:hypothetical protein